MDGRDDQLTQGSSLPIVALTERRTHTTKLTELSQKCAGWMVFNDGDGETFVPLERWLSLYEANRARFDIG